MTVRSYCIFSAEAVALMKGSRGKLAAQAGHAYLHSYWDAEERLPNLAAAYRDPSTRAYKIALIVPDEAALRELEGTYWPFAGVSLVKDAGFTVFDEPTVTCVGILLDDANKGDDLKSLKAFQ